MAKPRKEKFVWVTWLSRLMSGEISCQWAPWFKTRFEFERVPTSPELVSWKVTHNRQVSELKRVLMAEGKRVLPENQARFRYRIGDLTLSGAPDLIAISEEVEIHDCKTGSPRDSDQIQVMIYMYCLPKARPEFQGKQIKGFVVYPQKKIEISEKIIDAQFEENLHYFLSILEKDEKPPRFPSQDDCRFCDISIKDCPEKMF